MRKIPVFRLAPAFVFAASLILAASPLSVHGQTADPSTLDQISSQRYIVIDSETGEIYAENDADIRGGMASVTKIFTAIVALERAPLDMEIVADESDVFDETSTAMSGFYPGNSYPMKDLLYGMMLESGNNAAQALARGIGAQPGDSPEESVTRFMGWANDKVAQLGLANTHLSNPHGLSAPDHYTTPRDLAKFMLYAVQNPDFMEVISARDYTTSAGLVIYSINRGPQFIPDYFGGKTGFDFDTGYCLVEVGRRDGVQLISVTIDGVAPDIWYIDHAILQDYAFAARADRIAAGEPLGDNVVAIGPPVESQATEPEAQDVAQEAPDTQAETAFIGEIAAPRPVQVAGPIAPPVEDTMERNRIFDHWIAGILVLVIVIAALSLKSIGGIPWSSSLARQRREIDTPA